jgi:flagellar motor switch protein FliM
VRSLGEGFASRFSVAASRLLSRGVKLMPSETSRRSYAELLPAPRDSAFCYLLASASSPGPVLLDISPEIAMAVIDGLLSGPGGIYVPQRRPSALERRLFARVAEAAAESLRECWPGQAPLALRPAGEAAAAGTDPAGEDVVVLTFQMAVECSVGYLRLGVPESMLRGLPAAEAAEGAAPTCQSPLITLVELTAAVEDVTVSAEDLEHLAPGDILATDTAADGDVLVRIGGIPRFLARLLAHSGRRAVAITGRK